MRGINAKQIGRHRCFFILRFLFMLFVGCSVAVKSRFNRRMVMNNMRIVVLLVVLVVSKAASAASGSSLVVNADPSSPRPGQRVSLTATLSGDILVRRIVPNRIDSKAYIHFFVGNVEVAKYAIVDLNPHIDHNRFDTTYTCGPSGACQSVQLVYENASKVQATYQYQFPQGVRSTAVYATFDGDKWAAASAAPALTVKISNSSVAAITPLVAQ